MLGRMGVDLCTGVMEAQTFYDICISLNRGELYHSIYPHFIDEFHDTVAHVTIVVINNTYLKC